MAGSAIPAGEKKTGEEEENEEADWDLKEEEEEDEGIGQEESGFDETNEEKEGKGEYKEEETDDRKGGRIERRDTDEMEEFVDVEDYNWFGGPSQKIEKTADKEDEETDNGELVSSGLRHLNKCFRMLQMNLMRPRKLKRRRET